MRTGFTTGAAAAAAAKGALLHILNKKPSSKVEITFLTGGKRVISIHSSRLEADNTVRCTVIKDAGDDPDVTHRAEIGATVTLHSAEDAAGGSQEGQVRIMGGLGVGTVTKPGLEIPPGNAAINPGPIKMITNEIGEVLRRHGLHHHVDVEVFGPEGKRLAKKTLNARLGILNGLSILGTTGVVKPLSHAAYVATIASSLSVARAAGLDRVVLTTGRRSERFSQDLWKDLPEEAFIQMGDYFKKTIEAAVKNDFKTLVLAVFFGKAVKMAQGVPHTHAAKSAMTLQRLSDWTLDLTGNKALSSRVLSANTARHAFDLLLDGHRQVIARVGAEMCRAARRFAGSAVHLHCVIFDYNGSVIFDSDQPI